MVLMKHDFLAVVEGNPLKKSLLFKEILHLPKLNKFNQAKRNAKGGGGSIVCNYHAHPSAQINLMAAGTKNMMARSIETQQHPVLQSTTSNERKLASTLEQEWTKIWNRIKTQAPTGNSQRA